MLEITKKNCNKCDLETIIDPSDSQYFWINRRDWKAESEGNWQNILISMETHRLKNIGKN